MRIRGWILSQIRQLDEPYTVNELWELIGDDYKEIKSTASQNNLSAHLSHLHQAGLIDRYKKVNEHGSPYAWGTISAVKQYSAGQKEEPSKGPTRKQRPPAPAPRQVGPAMRDIAIGFAAGIGFAVCAAAVGAML